MASQNHPALSSFFSADCVAGPTPLNEQVSEAALGQKQLLLLLFRLFEEQGICYCVLHGWESLPEELPSDLDLAIHPSDRAKLPSVFQALVGEGYELIQCRNYAVGGNRFDFVWFASEGMRSAGIDVIDEYRQRGLILIAGEELVRNRQQFNYFWVANPGTEFAYILAKKALKGTLPQHQAERLKVLVNELGKVRSLGIAGELFGEGWRERVVESCSSGTLGNLLGQLKKRLWLTKLRKNPLNPLRYCLCNLPRLVGRALKPSGLFLAILGPDGVGKSTLVERLAESFGTAFERFRLYHWRPNLLAPQKETGVAVTNPHGAVPRRTLSSIIVLLGLLLDHWLGYIFVLRPFLTCTGFVIFDRYYQDLLIDPIRYRYGGPRWLAEFVGRLIPKPDLILILDAPEQVTLSRKQEVSLEELQRQRGSYLQWSKYCSSACVIDAADAPPLVAGRATRAILGSMEKRLKGRLFWPRAEHKVAAQPMPDARNGEGCHEGALRSALDQFAMHLPGYSKTREKAAALTQGICGRSNGSTHRHHFVILPSRKKPRWLLPLGNVEKTRHGLGIYTPYGLTARLLQSVLARAIEMGWQGWAWPKVLIASEMPLALETLVREVTGEDQPAFALSLGTPGRYRKLTLQVMRPNGDILGYIKLPLTRPATERVRGEAQTLQHLWSLDRLRRHIPRVLYAANWGDGYILFQSSRAYRQGPVEFSSPHEEFLTALWRVHPTAKPGQELVDEVQLEWKKIEPYSPSGWRELAETVFDRASRDLAGKTLAWGIGHGDFAPWNTRVGDGSLFVFDWEHAAVGVPNLWDVFHFHVQVNSLLQPRKQMDFSFARSPTERASFLLFVMNSVCRLLDEEANRPDAIAFRQRLLLSLLSGMGN